MYCNLALFQWTLFSLCPREEAILAWGHQDSTSGLFLCVSAPESARGKLRFEVFLVGSVAGAGRTEQFSVNRVQSVTCPVLY